MFKNWKCDSATLFVTLLVVGVFFVFPEEVKAKHCFLGFFGINCSHEPPPPPPPPPPPTIEALCDGKKPPNTYVHYHRPACTNPNDIKRGENLTLKLSYFPPNRSIYEVTLFDYQSLGPSQDTLHHAITWAPYIGDRPGPPKHPDEYKTNDNGEITLVVTIPEYQSIRAYSETLPPGEYTYRVGVQDMGRFGTNVRLGVTSEPAPPPAPPAPEPPKPPAPTPEPPKLPSDGSCDSTFRKDSLYTCFFDGIEAPIGANPTLDQYSFTGDAYFSAPLGSWTGFDRDWGTGVVANTGKSDQVSAVWRGKINFKGGTYNFHTKSDDGIELVLDNKTLIRNWSDHPIVQDDANKIKIPAGYHDVQLRWYENGGGAGVGLWWDLETASGGPCDTTFPENKFHVCFFDNLDAPVGPDETLFQIEQTPVNYGAASGQIETWLGISWYDDEHLPESFKALKELSSVWRGRVNFTGGIYDIRTGSVGGIEIKIDGKVMANSLDAYEYRNHNLKNISVSSGYHDIQIRWHYSKRLDKGMTTLAWELRFLPELIINPKKAKPGDTIMITGWPGFSSNTRVSVYFDDMRLNSVYLTSDLSQITIPTTATNGTHTIKITHFDGLGQTLSTPIEIDGGKTSIKQTLIVDPTTVFAGDQTSIKGSNWSGGEKTFSLVALDEKKFNLDAVENRCLPSTGKRICEDGDIFYVAKIPANLAPGTYSLLAFGNEGKEKASAEIKVLARQEIKSDSPKIVLNPTSGNTGIAVVVTGAGFTPKSGLTAKFDAEKIVLGQGAGLVTDERGSFSTIIYISLGAKLGKHKVSFSTGIQAGAATQVISGSYRCLQTSRGQSCRSFPPIVMKADGTYSISLEKGTYIIGDYTISLSESKIRGVGTFNKTHTEIQFKYKYNNQDQEVVYLWEDINSPPVLKQKEQKAGDYAEAEFTVTVAEKSAEKQKEKSSEKEAGGASGKSFGDTVAPKFGDDETKKYGDIKTEFYGDVETKTYGDIETKSYGGVPTKTYGDVNTKAYGDVETKSYGDVETKTYGDINTKTYGDVETKTYGDVKPPTYETPEVKPGECNPLISKFYQPNCKEPSSLNKPPSYFAGIFDFFRNLFSRKPKKEVSPKPAQESMRFVPPTSSDSSVENKEPAKEVPPKIPKVEVKPAPKVEAPKIASKSSKKLSGSYRCWSYNVSGGGGSCRISPPIVLKTDGGYSMSSEVGTYYIEGDQIFLSESKIRGPGKLLEGDIQIRFEYDYNGWHHTITYLREENANAEPAPAEVATLQEKYVEVTLHIKYPAGDYSADSVNTVTLYSKDGGEQIAQSLAYATDRSTTEVWFSKRSPKVGLLTGQIYKIFVSSGFGSEWQVGELDLRNITDDTTITIQAKTQ
ncbi:MAG: PA14 domain-containing protein [bacterium]|nr:PA14 domain-containing protein [bacterium]